MISTTIQVKWKSFIYYWELFVSRRGVWLSRTGHTVTERSVTSVAHPRRVFVGHTVRMSPLLFRNQLFTLELVVYKPLWMIHPYPVTFSDYLRNKKTSSMTPPFSLRRYSSFIVRHYLRYDLSYPAGLLVSVTAPHWRPTTRLDREVSLYEKFDHYLSVVVDWWSSRRCATSGPLANHASGFRSSLVPPPLVFVPPLLLQSLLFVFSGTPRESPFGLDWSELTTPLLPSHRPSRPLLSEGTRLRHPIFLYWPTRPESSQQVWSTNQDLCVTLPSEL